MPNPTESPAYLFQTPAWAEFWRQSKSANHNVIKLTERYHGVEFQGFVYEYPNRLRGKFWFIPAGPHILNSHKADHQSLQEGLISWLLYVINKARDREIEYIQLHLSQNLSANLQIHQADQLLNWLKQNLSEARIPDLNTPKKRLMYEESMVVDLSEIHKLSPNLRAAVTDNTALETFFHQTRPFWLKTNDTTRNQTKRSLKQSWTLSTDKDPHSIQALYEILKETGQRQSFHLPSQTYFQTLCAQPNTYLHLIKDQNQTPQAAWLGIYTGKLLTNLYGGNRPASFKGFGPNYMHLAGIYLATCLGCQYYDLGGYNPKDGAGRFKNGYRGQIWSYPGPVNIVLKPWMYQLENFLQRLR